MKLTSIKGSTVINSSGDEFGTVNNFRFKDGLDYLEVTDKKTGKDTGAVIKSHDDNGNIIISTLTSPEKDLKIMFMK